MVRKEKEAIETKNQILSTQEKKKKMKTKKKKENEQAKKQT